MIRKQIYLEEGMDDLIKEIAEKKDISQSEVIRRAVEKYISEEQKKGEVEDPLLELIGLGSSDVTDGSINHDHYIYGVPKKYDVE